MTEDEQGRQKKRRRLWLALAALVAILAVLIVPPLVSVSRYKSRITSLMACVAGQAGAALLGGACDCCPGRALCSTISPSKKIRSSAPSRCCMPATVTASIRLLSLWRGRLEISEISVDEASLNLVRSPGGRWNLDPLFRTAATRAGHGKRRRTCLRLRFLISRPPTPGSTSRTALRSCRFRWSTPIFPSGRRIPANGASGCAASRPAPT